MDNYYSVFDFYVIISKLTFKVDEDYKKLYLALESYNINYYTVYEERTELDRENLYYYDNKGIYAILDLKNEKLYYLKSYIYGTHNN